MRLQSELKAEGIDASIKLGIPGQLVVSVDGKTVFDHGAKGDFPKPGEIVKLVRPA